MSCRAVVVGCNVLSCVVVVVVVVVMLLLRLLLALLPLLLLVAVVVVVVAGRQRAPRRCGHQRGKGDRWRNHGKF